MSPATPKAHSLFPRDRRASSAAFLFMAAWESFSTESSRPHPRIKSARAILAQRAGKPLLIIATRSIGAALNTSEQVQFWSACGTRLAIDEAVTRDSFMPMRRPLAASPNGSPDRLSSYEASCRDACAAMRHQRNLGRIAVEGVRHLNLIADDSSRNFKEGRSRRRRTARPRVRFSRLHVLAKPPPPFLHYRRPLGWGLRTRPSDLRT